MLQARVSAAKPIGVQMNFFYYLMTTDNGGAPCCTPRLWSLAICKPSIRKRALPGDVVIGFAGKSIDRLGGFGVVHFAKVSARADDGAYYAPHSEHRNRADCIYERRAEGYFLKKNPFHGRGDMDRDSGRDRRNAAVLLSDEFRYFGNRRYEVDWSHHPALRACLVALRRGHRVNHSPRVLKEIQALSSKILRTEATLGQPTHSLRTRCDGDDGYCTC